MDVKPGAGLGLSSGFSRRDALRQLELAVDITLSEAALMRVLVSVDHKLDRLDVRHGLTDVPKPLQLLVLVHLEPDVLALRGLVADQERAPLPSFSPRATSIDSRSGSFHDCCLSTGLSAHLLPGFATELFQPLALGLHRGLLELCCELLLDEPVVLAPGGSVAHAE